MIPNDFEYYKPDTVYEAVMLHKQLSEAGKKPVYYGGGSEIISMARMFDLDAGAVIDIKGIPELHVYEIRDNKLIIGAAVTLTEIAEKNLFPLLSLTAKRIADHTNQDRITLGGNLAGTIIYNETSLPLLVTDSDIVIASYNKTENVPANSLYNKGIQLKSGDLIVQTETDVNYLSMPNVHAKRTKQDKIEYPVVSLCAIKDGNYIKIAFSGVCNYAFRSEAVEALLNDNNKDEHTRFNEILSALPGEVIMNLDASADFRKFLLKKMLHETVCQLGGL